MRAILALLLALAPVASTVSAQEPDRALVMHVGPAPDYRLSIGLVWLDGDPVTIRARVEMAPDCTWAGVPALTVSVEELVPMRDINPGEAPEQYGVLYATTYSALVAHAGGTPSAEYHGCVRQSMTDRATRQLQRQR